MRISSSLRRWAAIRARSSRRAVASPSSSGVLPRIHSREANFMENVFQRPRLGRNDHEEIRTIAEAGIARQIVHRFIGRGRIGEQNQNLAIAGRPGLLNDARELARADEADLEVTQRSGREGMSLGNERPGRDELRGQGRRSRAGIDAPPRSPDMFVQVDVAALPKAETLVVAAVNDGPLALQAAEGRHGYRCGGVSYSAKRRIFSVANRFRHWPIAPRSPIVLTSAMSSAVALGQTRQHGLDFRPALSVGLHVQGFADRAEQVVVEVVEAVQERPSPALASDREGPCGSLDSRKENTERSFCASLRKSGPRTSAASGCSG